MSINPIFTQLSYEKWSSQCLATASLVENLIHASHFCVLISIFYMQLRDTEWSRTRISITTWIVMRTQGTSLQWKSTPTSMIIKNVNVIMLFVEMPYTTYSYIYLTRTFCGCMSSCQSEKQAWKRCDVIITAKPLMEEVVVNTDVNKTRGMDTADRSLFPISFLQSLLISFIHYHRCFLTLTKNLCHYVLFWVATANNVSSKTYVRQRTDHTDFRHRLCSPRSISWLYMTAVKFSHSMQGQNSLHVYVETTRHLKDENGKMHPSFVRSIKYMHLRGARIPAFLTFFRFWLHFTGVHAVKSFL